MTPEGVVDLAQQALYLIGVLAAPIMGAALAVGVTVSTLQAATQINEMTLTFIPKLLAVGGVVYGAGSWMIEQWLNYTSELWLLLQTGGQGG
ncbi:MAG: flagellar biosynthetic protein FliQ [Bradymonadia bacterium]|jgi:flagellar biosynthetic protein FliQ